MDGETTHIDVRSVLINDAPALHMLDYSFETDRIYTLQVHNSLLQLNNQDNYDCQPGIPSFSFSLVETPVDPPIYKNCRLYEKTLEDVEARVRNAGGGYVALSNEVVAGAVLLNVEEWRSVARIEALIVGHQFRRYGVGSLLLNCAFDWARRRNCWAAVLETQNINYPAIQFYLRNGLEVWSIQRHFYPPGPSEHEVAIFMGKRLINLPA